MDGWMDICVRVYVWELKNDIQLVEGEVSIAYIYIRQLNGILLYYV